MRQLGLRPILLTVTSHVANNLKLLVLVTMYGSVFKAVNVHLFRSPETLHIEFFSYTFIWAVLSCVLVSSVSHKLMIMKL